jgi:hypothetical protein
MACVTYLMTLATHSSSTFVGSYFFTVSVWFLVINKQSHETINRNNKKEQINTQ